MSLQIASPFQQFFDRDGSPLDNGFVYVGVANQNPETNPLTIYFDDALTIPAAQPLRTSNGYIVRNGSPARLYTSQEDFSLTVRDKSNVLVFTVAEATSLSNLATQLASGSGSSLIGYNQGGLSAVDRTAQDRLRDFVSVKDFGAIGDGVADDAAAIQAAIDAVYLNGGGEIVFPAGTYLCSTTIAPKRGVVCTGEAFGSVIIKLANNANTVLIESFKFSILYGASAYQISDDPDMTYDYGFKNIIFDGNRANQTSGGYLVKMYGRRLILRNCILANSIGVGLWTALRGSHSGGYDFTKTKTPGDMGEIEIVDTNEEAWIWEGPSDQQVGQLVINQIGIEALAVQTSTHFPGQPVHGLRLESGSFHISNANLNNVYHGRGLYNNLRATLGDIIIAGCWGNFYNTASGFGQVNSLRVQANQRTSGGVPNPSIENLSNRFQFGTVEALRVSGQDQTSVPLIRDSGGANWGLVQNRQSPAELGVFFEASSNDVNINTLRATGADVALQTLNGCQRIDVTCIFNNCNTTWENQQTDIRGSWDFVGSLSSGSGQVFSTGIDAAPNADEESLSNARIEFFDTTTSAWKSNSFRGVENFDASTTAGQTIVFTHGMWRAPKVEEISLAMRVSGWSAEPQGMSLSVAGFNATSINARVKLTTAATTPLVSQIICKVS